MGTKNGQWGRLAGLRNYTEEWLLAILIKHDAGLGDDQEDNRFRQISFCFDLFYVHGRILCRLFKFSMFSLQFKAETCKINLCTKLKLYNKNIL